MIKGPLPTNKTRNIREMSPPSTVDELHYTNHPLTAQIISICFTGQ